MNYNTAINLKLIPALVKLSEKKSLSKPPLFRNQTQIELRSCKVPEKTEFSYKECLQGLPDQGGYSFNDNVHCSSDLYIDATDKLITSLTYSQRRVFSLLFTAKKTLKKVYFSINTISKMLDMCYRTVSEALNVLEECELISRVSGKRKHRTNLYFVKSMLFIKEFRKVIKRHLKIISDFAPKAFFQQLPTTLRNIILRIRNTYNKLINSVDRQSINLNDFMEGRSPVVKSNNVCSPNNFFNEKDKSCLFAHTRIASKPPGTVTTRNGEPESNVLTSGNMLRSTRDNVSRIYTSVVEKDTQVWEIVMIHPLSKIRDIEAENMGTQRRSSRRGPIAMCDQMRQDLLRSIRYHFGGGYVHKDGDRIIDKATTKYLRKKYGL